MTKIDHITIGKISIPLPADPTPESMTLLAPPVLTVPGTKLTAFFRWKLVGVIAADDASGTLTYSTTTGTATSAAHQKAFAYQVTGEVSADLGAINTQIRSDFEWSTTESQVFNMSATETKEIEIDVDKGQIVAIWQIVCEYQRNAGGVKGIQNVSTHFHTTKSTVSNFENYKFILGAKEVPMPSAPKLVDGGVTYPGEPDSVSLSSTIKAEPTWAMLAESHIEGLMKAFRTNGCQAVHVPFQTGAGREMPSNTKSVDQLLDIIQGIQKRNYFSEGVGIDEREWLKRIVTSALKNCDLTTYAHGSAREKGEFYGYLFNGQPEGDGSENYFTWKLAQDRAAILQGGWGMNVAGSKEIYEAVRNGSASIPFSATYSWKQVISGDLESAVPDPENDDAFVVKSSTKQGVSVTDTKTSAFGTTIGITVGMGIDAISAKVTTSLSTSTEDSYSTGLSTETNVEHQFRIAAADPSGQKKNFAYCIWQLHVALQAADDAIDSPHDIQVIRMLRWQ